MLQPRIVHLPSAVLPAGGVFTDQPFYDISVGLTGLTFTVIYTRGAAGSRPLFRFEWGNTVSVPPGTGEVGRDVSADGGSGAVFLPNCQFDLCLTQFRGPVPIDDTPLIYLVPACTVPPGERRVRLIAQEDGTPLTPGTLEITLVGFGP